MTFDSLAATQVLPMSKPEYDTGTGVGLLPTPMYCTAASSTSIIIF